MSKVVFTEDVREVYWAQTNEYNIKIGEKNYKVRVFEDSNGCEERMHPKKEDFLLASLCIETADGDYDLVGEILFNGKVLEEDELQSGTQQMSAMFIYKADGNQTEIS